MAERTITVELKVSVWRDIVRGMDYVLDDEKTTTAVWGAPSGALVGRTGTRAIGMRRAEILHARNQIALAVEKKPETKIDYFADGDE